MRVEYIQRCAATIDNSHLYRYHTCLLFWLLKKKSISLLLAH